MRILYGIQGTGNGHLSRARAMAKHFRHSNAEVTYLFSGRERDKFFEMEIFGDFEVRRGLTFTVDQGKVSYFKTALNNNVFQFAHEIISLDLSPYDLVLCDFEPVTAWAAKLRGKPIISFGHQPAFHHPIPIKNKDMLALAVLKHFAPAPINIGLHWHHYDSPILPPIIHFDQAESAIKEQQNKVLVYLPFEDPQSLKNLFEAFTHFEFYLYHPAFADAADEGHLHFRPLSVEPFRQDLLSSPSVICNAGFELPSECIHFGKKILVKPVANQMEQASNAETLVQLGLGASMNQLCRTTISQWLEQQGPAQHTQYPDVAKALVEWILKREWHNTEPLNSLWAQVQKADCKAI